MAAILEGAIEFGRLYQGQLVTETMLAAAGALRAIASETPDPAEVLARRAAEVKDAADVMAAIRRDDVARLVFETLKTACPDRCLIVSMRVLNP